MKKAIFSFAIIGILFSSYNNKIQAQDKLDGQISISGAFALYPLAVKWADEFKKIHPNVRIDVSAGGAGKGITDALSNMVDIGMVSRDINPEETKKGAFPISVTKDAVVAVVNASNPDLKNILAKGVTQSILSNIWISGKATSWKDVDKNGSKAPIHIYTRSDASGAAEVWAKFFGKKQEDLLGVGVFGDPGLETAVKNDVLGIGYNNIGYAYDQTTKKQQTGIKVVPIDLNNNGKIDPEEDFYATIDNIVEAIAEGKYPSPPARELYFVTNGRPVKPLLKEFIKWVLTDGQKFVLESGYINLKKEKLSNELKKI
jgi:phosphate transport system substrate-binding protein